MKRLALLFISLMFIECEKKIYEAPEIIYPENNKILTEEKITLYWHKIPGASYYSVVVMKDSSIIINRTFIKDTSFSFLIKKGGNFKCRVGVTYTDKESLWSEWVNFTHYEVPEVIYPQNNQTLIESRITFCWHKVKEAIYYSIVVMKEDSIIINRTSIKDTSFSFTPEEEGNFKWKVGATYPDKKTAWSDWAEFIYKEIHIPSPILIEPENHSTLKDLTVKFVWSKVNVKNVYYTFHLYEKDDEMKLIYSTHLKDTTLTYSFPFEGEFIWKVGIFLEGKSDTTWSDSYTFSIIYEEDENLLVPVNYLPLIEINFCWRNANASSHTLQIASDSSFHHIIEEFTTSDTQYLYHPYELSTGTYYWHVIYNFPDGTRKLGVIRKFYVKPYKDDYLLMYPDSMNIYTSARWWSVYYLDPNEGESDESFEEWFDTIYLVKLKFNGESWVARYNDERSISYSPGFKKVYLWGREFTNPPHDTAFDEWRRYHYKIYYSGDTLILESSFYDEDEWYWWYKSWEKISKYVKNKCLINHFYYYDYAEGWQTEGVTTHYETEKDTMYLRETRPRGGLLW